MSGICVKGSVVLSRQGEEPFARGKNLITTAGLNAIASAFAFATAVRPTHMAIGTGTGLTTATMTALQGTEVQRVAFASSMTSNNIVSFEASFGTGVVGTATCSEVAVFTASSGGTMLNRMLANPFSISSSDTIIAAWELTFQGDES